MDRFDCPPQPQQATHLLPDLEHAIARVDRLQQLPDRFRRDARGLLAVHVLARLKRRNRHLHVQVARRFDEHRIDVLASEQLVIVLQRRRLVAGRDRCAAVQTVRLEVA